jgi:AcrR family transcriptional regulator
VQRTNAVGARERLLEVAGRLFYADGIHAVGVDRVIAEAGVAKATLYAHFSGKEELVAAYLSRRSSEWQAWVDASLPGLAQDSADRVLGLFDLLAERFSAPDYRGCPFINAAAEYPGQGLVAEQISAHRARVRRLFHRLLDEMAQPDPGGLTETLMVLYDGAMVAAQLDANPRAARYAQSVADRLLR